MRSYYKDPDYERRVSEVVTMLDLPTLKRVCETHEDDFGNDFGFERVTVHDVRGPNYYYYKDNGSNILAVAHLDTVADHAERTCRFVDSEAGPVVFSRALDDRLGAYVITQLLPLLGLEHDILLTIGEESGESTARLFTPPPGKDYHWMIEFDRGGTDTVMYQYEDDETSAMVEDAGVSVGSGSFSDISYLEHLEIKGFNWGVGYTGNYHGPRAHAFLADTVEMVARYLRFHEVNKDTYLPHEEDRHWGRYSGSSYGSGYRSMWADEDCEYQCGRPDWYCLDDPCEERREVMALDEEPPDFIENPTQEDHEALVRALGLADEREVERHLTSAGQED